jgi:hypothetical protein
MQTSVEFTADAFPPYPRESEQINPGIWGKRLAEFIASKLPDYGVHTDEFYSEDWGWEIPVKNAAFPIYIGCGNQTEPGGNRSHEGGRHVVLGGALVATWRGD